MDVNPYESSMSAESCDGNPGVTRWTLPRLYRLAAVGLCIAVLGTSGWLSLVPEPEMANHHVTYDVYCWLTLLSGLSWLLFPLRLLYLLIRWRFQQAAIDAVLAVVTFLALSLALRLVPISA